MKKVFVVTLFTLVVVFGLVAQNDPFATRRFLNGAIEVSFRTEDSEGRPQVYFKNGSSEQNCYYNFDDEYLVLFASAIILTISLVLLYSAFCGQKIPPLPRIII